MAARALTPEHVREYYGGTTREFKQAKREEVGAVIEALDELSTASAWLPYAAYMELRKARAAMENMRGLVSLQKWGR